MHIEKVFVAPDFEALVKKKNLDSGRYDDAVSYNDTWYPIRVEQISRTDKTIVHYFIQLSQNEERPLLCDSSSRWFFILS